MASYHLMNYSMENHNMNRRLCELSRNGQMESSVIGRMLGRNVKGQIGVMQVPMLVGLIIVVIGLGMVGTHLGTGLIWIGAGLAIGGFGGYATLHHPIFAISGAGGIVVIILGALIERLT